jgi:predicted O-methyltransferase YrrM
MSFTITPVTGDLADYVIKNFSSEDEFLTNLREESSLAGIPAIQISPEQGKFLQFFLKSIRAKYVLEVGTLAGYSAITMARALPDDGKLISIEYEFEHAIFAKKKTVEAGLDNIIEIQNSNAREFLKTFNPEFQFDFIFVDADKPSYKFYLDILTPMLKVGGIFAADNAFAFGFLSSSKPERNPEDVKSIQGFNDYFINHTNYFTSIVPVGDGMIMGIKLR